MSTSGFPDLAVGVLLSGFRLFSMTPHIPHTTPSSPTMSSPSRSEKLLRDALLRDERERQHRSSPPLPTTKHTHRRRHTLSPTSSYSASTKEDYACSSSHHTAMNLPSPYRTSTANSSPNCTPSRIPVRNQTHRKKEGGLELRLPTQGHSAAVAGRGQEMEPPRSLDLSSRRRPRDVTITQLSHQALRSPTGSKKSINNTDDHSLFSTESCSTGTSESSVSHLHIGYASGYSASHSSFLDPVSAPPQLPPHFSVGNHPVHHPQPNHPSPSTKHFNARKASTQCRAMEGYVSFANVEGLGEPPLVGDEFDEDGRGKGNGDNGRIGAVTFLPLGVLNAALRWKKFVGGVGPGISHGVEGKDQGVVV